jgi:hypothetical protein
MLTLIEREQFLRQQNLKQQMQVIGIVVAIFVLMTFLIVMAPNGHAFQRAFTSTISDAPNSSTLISSGDSKSGRKQADPFQGFRNVGSGK